MKPRNILRPTRATIRREVKNQVAKRRLEAKREEGSPQIEFLHPSGSPFFSSARATMFFANVVEFLHLIRYR